MLSFAVFPFTGAAQTWTVPPNVTRVRMECWGGAGGMASELKIEGPPGNVVGGHGRRCGRFNDKPDTNHQVGVSFSNSAGYAAGTLTVTPGQVFQINVGGNGAPGFSSIKRPQNSDTRSAFVMGGAGGWNGGGDGGPGAHVYLNLYNAATIPYVRFTGRSTPASAEAGDLWYETHDRVVFQCARTYTGTSDNAAWSIRVSQDHPHLIGPSGGGGGGATDIRTGASGASRILVAGGAGGAAAVAEWDTASTPDYPNPPFDDLDSRYVVGGYGHGGLGGSASTDVTAAVPASGGVATAGGAGGLGTGMSAMGDLVVVEGSAGQGGGVDAGGLPGGGTATAGTGYNPDRFGVSGVGGTGSAATAGGTYSDWCAGGGGGGGGFYGGGGGAPGFWGAGTDGGGGIAAGGGGGGGSNYASAAFEDVVLLGAARPPAVATPDGQGANGLGGYVRILWDAEPAVAWDTVPKAVAAGVTNTATFKFTPALPGGAPISYYQVGVGATGSTEPANYDTYAPDASLDTFSWDFSLASVGYSVLYVRAADDEGDLSPWVGVTVRVLSSAVAAGATLLTPSYLAPLGSTTVTWTPPSDLVAYRLGVVGLKNGVGRVVGVRTGWRRGGSRINLASGATWAHAATTSTYSSPGGGTTYADAWAVRTGANDSAAFTQLVKGVTYRLRIALASGAANDTRPVQLLVKDSQGTLARRTFKFSGAAGTFVTATLPFTPRGENVQVVITPSSTAGKVGDTDAGQVTYFGDVGIEIAYEEDAAGLLAYLATTSTGTSVSSGTLTYGTDLRSCTLFLDTLTSDALAVGFPYLTATRSIRINPSTPATPTVTLTADHTGCVMTLDIDAADSGAAHKTVGFDIFRDGVRVATGLKPDRTTRRATFYDAPGTNTLATYMVRAVDSLGGETDQTDGTVVQ